MAIIVRHKGHNGIYVLVGTSYSYFKDSRPSFLGGTLFPHEEEGLFKLAAVADENGKIEWYPTDDLRVLKINGKNIKDILTDFKSLYSDLLEIGDKMDEYNHCPGCGHEVNEKDKECPSCGLNFMIEE